MELVEARPLYTHVLQEQSMQNEQDLGDRMVVILPIQHIRATLCMITKHKLGIALELELIPQLVLGIGPVGLDIHIHHALHHPLADT